MRSYPLLHPVFLLALASLLLNDFIFKAAYGNLLTGKLSDFAGVLALPFFLHVLLRIRPKIALWSTAAFFIFWKSPLSQGLIDTVNALTNLSWVRVVDYTDLLALSMLPLAGWCLQPTATRLLKKQQWYAGLQTGVAILALFAFVATSEQDFPFISDPSVESCCALVPQEQTIGDGNVFIPNAFTPDGNGINDYFYIKVDDEILMIDTLMVRRQNNTGDTVYYQINITDFAPENGFDGEVNDTIVAEQYYYFALVTSTDNQQHFFDGYVCAIPCTEELGIPVPFSFPRCGFASQHDFTNGFDPTSDVGEDLDCFEE